LSTWYRRAIRHVWPDLPVKPTEAEIAEAQAQPERRRVPYAKVSDMHGLRNRMILALLFLAAVSSFAVWRVVQEGKDTDMANCVNGREFRILVAQSNDQLRRAAVGLVPGQNANPRVKRFLIATQPAIDGLLTQAAGKPVHAHGPGGEVNAATIREAQRMARARCEERIDGNTDTKGS
jgi:hypothetical protein